MAEMLATLGSGTRGVVLTLVAFALPPRCPGCGAITLADHQFCADCWQAMNFLGGPACATCGVPFPFDAGLDARCPACVAAPPALDSMRAAVDYGDIARRLVLRLKHGRRPGLAETIARRLDRLVHPHAVLLAPVPLHRWRIWSRGYNQSALIGRALAHRVGLPFDPDLLCRTRHTPMLRGLGRHARARAVRSAFTVRNPEAVAGRVIVLVDDVFTTGATANACAATLKQAGATAVHLLCWARVALEGVEDDMI
jgi:ComF family protein